ncbi:hypothetical protein [Actinoallomurus acaciae]|uniref:DJ-1/PfpI domain-containing protein n=1 Tax=Actinoallomurus acaciae TaxID=502577 RepID=A0ABV5YLL8_9ACTN
MAADVPSGWRVTARTLESKGGHAVMPYRPAPAAELLVEFHVKQRLSAEATFSHRLLSEAFRASSVPAAHVLDPSRPDGRVQVVVADPPAAQCPRADVLLVPGGPGARRRVTDEPLLTWIRRGATTEAAGSRRTDSSMAPASRAGSSRTSASLSFARGPHFCFGAHPPSLFLAARPIVLCDAEIGIDGGDKLGDHPRSPHDP